MSKLEDFLLQPSGWVPNNARLPVLLCRGAIAADRSDAAAFETTATDGRHDGATASMRFTISIRHCNLGSNRDFLVVGADPSGPDRDTCRKALVPAALDRMQGLPIPTSDPVQGSLSGTKIGGQYPPPTPATGHIADRVQHLAQVYTTLRPRRAGSGRSGRIRCHSSARRLLRLASDADPTPRPNTHGLN